MVFIVETMDTRERLLNTLKRNGPATVPELQAELAVSENTVRHHLRSLRSDGLIEERVTEPSGPGRPAQQYELTAAAEGEFPKRYAELLALILEQAAERDDLAQILDGVARKLGAQVRPEIAHLGPEDRLLALMERLDYGDMLGRLETTPGGWEFRAFNCVYRDAGVRFEEVCELLPRIVRAATDLPCERVVCQRDGHRSCVFAGGFIPEGG